MATGKPRTSKILIVDDEPQFELMVSKIFSAEIRSEEYTFEFAQNGKQALERLHSVRNIDAVVTDINMPEMDGLTLLSKVQGQYPHVVTVVISAYGDLENIRTTMNSGAFDFLVKPVDRHDFRKTLAKTIRQVSHERELREARYEKEHAQREHLRSLKQMDRLKDEFLANVSQELLMPLNGMVGIADTLSDGAVGPLSQQLGENLSMIVASGKRLTTLVHDILDFSKLKNNQIKVQIRPIDVRPVIDVVLGLAQLLLKGKNVNLHACLSNPLPKVLADENRLHQVLHNLISNAVKFTDRGSITVFAEHEQGKVTIRVVDTGIGIPDEIMNHLFHAFERLEEPHHPHSVGRGLGLAITYQLIKLLGGEIQATSKDGAGSEFRFSLPAVEEQVLTDQLEPSLLTWQIDEKSEPISEIPMPQPSERMGTIRILAVDDEPVNLRVLKNQFSLHSYQVDTALSGADALQAVANYPDYDLVLLDMMMPGMSGFEVCRELRQHHSLFDLPILILTTRDHPSSYLEGLNAGANDYLPKPFDECELMARAKTLLILKQAVRQAILHNRHLESERLKRGLADNLRKITETLTSTLDLKQVMKRFSNSLQAVAPFNRSMIMLLTEKSLEPASIHGYDEADSFRFETVLEATSTLFQLASDSGQPVVIDRPCEDPRFINAWFSSPDTSLLAVSFGTNQNVTGMLLLERDGLDSFSTQETQLVAAFAGQAAIAIDNARLFEKVQIMAKTEELTGLNNRRHFFVLGKSAFEHARAGSGHFSAIMLDVDHFKRCNDSYGHAIGDAVLQTVAHRIRIACRKTDIMGRYGGEEFAVLLPDTNLAIAYEVAERLRQEIQKKFFARTELHSKLAANKSNSIPIIVTASLGVAEMNEDTTSLAGLLQQADRALYLAKDMGRNCTLTFTEISEAEAGKAE